MFNDQYKILTINDLDDTHFHIYVRKWYWPFYFFTGINCRSFGDAKDIVEIIKAEE